MSVKKALSNSGTLCLNLEATMLTLGSSLFARRAAFKLAYPADNDACSASFKHAHIALKFIERDGCDHKTAMRLATELQGRTVEERKARPFDKSKNENNVYVSAGTALYQMCVDTGFKDKPERKSAPAKAKEETSTPELTPAAATSKDVVAWFKAEAARNAAYLDRNMALIKSAKLDGLAEIASVYIEGVSKVSITEPRKATARKAK